MWSKSSTTKGSDTSGTGSTTVRCCIGDTAPLVAGAVDSGGVDPGTDSREATLAMLERAVENREVRFVHNDCIPAPHELSTAFVSVAACVTLAGRLEPGETLGSDDD